MGWSILDLSNVTDSLIGVLNTAIQNSPLFHTVQPFVITVTGSAPETVRSGSGCQLNMYLLHVSRDPYWRNTTVVTDAGKPPRVAGLPVGPGVGRRQQPLALNLSYLMTAFGGADYHQEQQAMSIALHALHEQPIFKTPTEEFSIGVEADSIEEMSRLWQAVTVPIRLSAMFRVAVIFLTPSDQPAPAAPPPNRARIAVGAGFTSQDPQLYALASDTTYGNIPASPPADGVTAVTAPPVFVGGQRILIGGSGLDQVGPAPQSFGLFLRVPTASGPVVQWDISSAASAGGWITRQTGSEIELTLPAAYSAGTPSSPVTPPPAATPVPAIYLLALVNRTTSASSAPLPLPIAASITNPNPTPFPAKLTPNGAGVFTVTGAGFAPPPQTQVVLDVVGLASTATSPPGAGQFFVSTDGGTIQFVLPASLATGRYFVRVRVNGVESPPSFWVDVP